MNGTGVGSEFGRGNMMKKTQVGNPSIEDFVLNCMRKVKYLSRL